MTPATEISEALQSTVKKNDRRFFGEIASWMFAPVSIVRPSTWCEGVVLKTPGTYNRPTPVDFTGREFWREPIDAIDDPEVIWLTNCMGTGAGKTTIEMLQMLWAFKHEPFPGLHVMPAKDGPGGASAFANGSLIPTLEETPAFKKDIPTGARRRYDFTGTKIIFAGNNLDLAGCNSAAQLGNKRCRIVILGEQDKYKEKLGREAGADYLAGERTKGMSGIKIIRDSTPSLSDFGIWPHLMKSDLRRRFLPCWHCNSDLSSPKKYFVLIKDPQYTVLPTKMPDGSEIPFAKMRWDKEAKRKDGSWDMNRVIASARFECPHCGGHLRDENRIWLDKNGKWIPTREGDKFHRGHHLSSFYTPITRDKYGVEEFESTWGGMAQKFLKAGDSGKGMGGYINSDLAEVDDAQEHTDESVIEISSGASKSISSVTHWPEFSGDRQAKYPGFWYRVRRWVASVVRAERSAEQWMEFVGQISKEQKTIFEKLDAAVVTQQITRTDHWPLVAQWLLANKLTGAKLVEFMHGEFQGDLIRMLEFISKPERANFVLGKQGDSEMIEFGSADSWEEIDDAQHRHNIANFDMLMDARFGSMDSSEVFIECAHRCPPDGFTWYSPAKTGFGLAGHHSREKMPGHKPFAQKSWTPVLGYPSDKFWNNPNRAIKTRLPYAREEHDPNQFNEDRGTKFQFVFKLNAQWALSELAHVRKKNSFTIAQDCKFTGRTVANQPVTVEEYLLHMKGYYWDSEDHEWKAKGKLGGQQSRIYPNHGFDCEKNGLAWAKWKGIFKHEVNSTEGTK